MKKILYFTFIILIYSCSIISPKQDVKYFEFSEQKDIQIIEYELLIDTLNLDINDRHYIKTEIVKNDTSFLIIKAEAYTNNIYIFDPINNTEKKINFDTIGYNYQGLADFGYINKDSIFISYFDAEDYGFHDKLFFLCNNEGAVLKHYSLKDAPVLTRENPDTYVGETYLFYFSNRNEPFAFKDNKLFLFFSKSRIPGDTSYSDLPNAGYIDTKENKFYPIYFDFPDIELGKQYFHNDDGYFFLTFAHDGDLLFGFKYTPTIIKYNYKTGKSSKVQIKSSVFDTIYPFLSKEEIPKGHDFSMPYPKYYRLRYDKYRNLYYRFVLLPNQYGNREYLIIAADTTFNTIAEGFPYEKGQYDFNITDKYLFFKDNKCYNMKFRDGTNTELINQIKLKDTKQKTVNKELTHYVKYFWDIKEKDYTAVFMWQSAGCEGTLNFYLGMFQTNEQYYDKYNVYLFLISDNTLILKDILENYKISPENNSNILIDSTFEYGTYNDFEVHSLPRIIKVRNNKIEVDSIFSLEDGGLGVQNFIIESGKEQMELKGK